MNLNANKTDGTALPITPNRISASEWNQLVSSCMAFIHAAGLAPDSANPEQFLNAFKIIAANLELVGANTNLSNLTDIGKTRFALPDLSNITSVAKQTVASWIFPNYTNGISVSIPASGKGVWKAPSNGYLAVAVSGSYRNGYRILTSGQVIWQAGDDINSNTKFYASVLPIGIGTQLCYDTANQDAFESISTIFYAV